MRRVIVFLVCFVFLLSGCQSRWEQGKLQNTGLLLEDTIDDEGWGTKGYNGLLAIQGEFGNQVYYKEDMKTKDKVIHAVEEFKKENVNLVFGHGKIFADIFDQISPQFPGIHFVCFNGNVTEKNVTSLNFNSYASGFFAGMTASEMTKTGHVGTIAAQEWQPEIKGYVEGARYYKKSVFVHQSFIHNWDDQEKAIKALRSMESQKTDVVYPAGDGFMVPVIEEAKSDGLYSIGYVSDQSDLGKEAVLTSTVQQVEKLYTLVAKWYDEGKLNKGNMYFDFKDSVVSMGKFSPVVPKSFQDKIHKDIQNYIRTGILPNGEKSPNE